MLTIILGLVVYFSAILNENRVSDVNNNELNRHLDDLTSLLVSTSGNPYNWEKLSSMNGVKSVGLKSTSSNLISYDKLIKLKENNYLLDDFLPSGIYYSVTLQEKGTGQSTLLAGEYTLDDKKNIQTRQVPIIIDYGYNILSTKMERHNNNCPYNHDEDTWHCMSININSSNLEDGDYYIITKKQTTIILSNTYSDNITKTSNNIVNINHELDSLHENENQTIYIHFKSKDNDTYIVYDKNNREEYLETIIQPRIYTLIIKVAT